MTFLCVVRETGGGNCLERLKAEEEGDEQDDDGLNTCWSGLCFRIPSARGRARTA